MMLLTFESLFAAVFFPVGTVVDQSYRNPSWEKRRAIPHDVQRHLRHGWGSVMIDSFDDNRTGYGLLEFWKDRKRYLGSVMRYRLSMMLGRSLDAWTLRNPIYLRSYANGRGQICEFCAERLSKSLLESRLASKPSLPMPFDKDRLLQYQILEFLNRRGSFCRFCIQQQLLSTLLTKIYSRSRSLRGRDLRIRS